MIQKMLTSALFAGSAAGLLAATLHFAFVQENILLGEQYETGAATHFAGVARDAEAHGHDAPAPTADPATQDPATEPSTLTRNALTALFSGVVYIAYALLLTAGFGVAASYGKIIAAREGLLWGIAGFATFQLAPAMGLAPELPGSLAADLAARQIWWGGTAAATATALALIGYGRGPVTFALAIALLAAPHLIGAPLPEGFAGTAPPELAPPELAAAFSARVLGVGLAVWASLGWLAGRIWSGTTA